LGWTQASAATAESLVTLGEAASGLRLEAFTLNFDASACREEVALLEGALTYRVCSAAGWQDWVAAGEVAGSEGAGEDLFALALSLEGDLASAVDLYYRVYVAELGWLAWTSNGAAAGTLNTPFAIEAVEVRMVPAGAAERELAYLLSGESSYHAKTLLENDLGCVAAVTSAANEAPTEAPQAAAAELELPAYTQGPTLVDASAVAQVVSDAAAEVEAEVEAATSAYAYAEAEVEGETPAEQASSAELYGFSQYRVTEQNGEVAIVEAQSQAEVEATSALEAQVEVNETNVQVEGETEAATGVTTLTLGTPGGAALTQVAVALEGDIFTQGLTYKLANAQGEWGEAAYDGATATVCNGGSLGQVAFELTGEAASWYDLTYRVYIEGLGWLDLASNGQATGALNYEQGVSAIELTIQQKSDVALVTTANVYDTLLERKMAAVVRAAKATPGTGEGWCAQWVANAYRNAGYGTVKGDACDMFAAWCTSSNREELKPGMLVAVPTHSLTEAGRIYGHVGIYIGDGLIMDNVETVRTMSLDTWLATYQTTTAAKWGFANS
jgi:hypothetical protein